MAALVLFPGSFVFSGVMTESTYLLLTAAAFYFAHRNRFVAAGVAAALAATSRSLGILLVACLLFEQLFPSRYGSAHGSVLARDRNPDDGPAFAGGPI